MIATIEDALSALGVTEDTLTPQEKESIDNLGYVVFHDAIPAQKLKELQDGYDIHKTPFSLKPDDAHTKEQEGSSPHSNIEYMSPVFDYAYTHPKHLTAVYRILKCRFQLFTIIGRDPHTPGKGAQGIHRDARRTADRLPVCCQSLWMLDDFTPDNGPTRIVPGTHFQDDARWIEGPVGEQALGPHPGQILLQGRAGSIAVFDSTLLHSATANQNGARRRTIYPTFCAHYFTNHFPHEKWITREMYDRISPAARFLLNVNQRPES